MKKIIYLAMFLCCSYSLMAQNSDAPKKGDMMFSVNFGVGSYIGTPAPIPNASSYTLSAPMTGWFDKKPILDVEARYFVTNKWALKLTGGMNYSHNPGYTEVFGTGTEEGDVPDYKAVPSSSNLQFNIGIGADHYVKTKWDQLFVRVGGEVGYAYGQVRATGDSEEYMGKTLGEAYSLRVAPVLGADYFFNQSLFLGFDIRPAAYQYSVYSQRPQDGMKLLSSDNHTFSLVSQPMIKLGIRF